MRQRARLTHAVFAISTVLLLGLRPGGTLAADQIPGVPKLEAIRDAFVQASHPAAASGPGLVWASLTLPEDVPSSASPSRPRGGASSPDSVPRLPPVTGPAPMGLPLPPPADMERLASLHGLTVQTLDPGGLAFAYAAPSGDTPDAVLTGSRFAATARTGVLTWEATRNLSVADSFGLTRRNRTSLSAFSDPGAFRSPWLVGTDQGQSAAVVAPMPWDGRLRITGFSSTTEDDDTDPAMDLVAAEWTQPLGGGIRLGVQAGRLSDGRDAIASRRDGFSLDGSAPTHFTGVSVDAPIFWDIKIVASLHAGWTSAAPAADSGLASASTLRSDSATFAVTGRGLVAAHDHFGLAAQQPLRVDAGTGVADMSGDAVPLSADGREIDIQAFYGVATTADSRLDASVTLRQDPGHDPGAQDEASGSLNWRMLF